MKKIITIVLDGYGYREEEIGNAIKKANTPNFDSLWNKYSHSLLMASEEAVGLPEGQMGGSEVGHQTIGAGRVIKQELVALNDFFSEKEYETNEILSEMIRETEESGKSLHLMGLLSDGGIHSHIKHLKEIIKIAKKSTIKNVYIHAIGDGRDTLPQVFMKYVHSIEKLIENDPRFKIASVCGRYYAMDRDNKWDRTKLYYDLVVKGNGYKALDLEKAINSCYKKDLGDEFLPPIILDSEGIIKNDDTLLWLNFRMDRARQILSTFINSEFDKFSVKDMSKLKLYSFYSVDKTVPSKVILGEKEVINPLGRYISDLGLSQARIAETEKYAHVTFFFDGQYKGVIEKCDRYLIPSPKVASYDQMPEMSAGDVCKKAISAMNKDYDFILVNFANADMVGHTGNFDATVKAVETVDKCLGELIESAELNFYTIFLLADHGNADEMFKENNDIITSHTLAKVPFLVTDEKVKLKDGSLANVAPAILKYMDIRIPNEMQETEQILDFE